MTKGWAKYGTILELQVPVVLIILWVVTRVPNPITGGKSFPIDEWGIAISVFEIAYIVITAIIVAKERNRMLQGTISKSQA